MIRRSLFVLVVLSLAACAAPPRDVETAPSEFRYSGRQGGTAVGVIPEGLLHDNVRNKDLPIAVDYPIKAGSYPLIVFSPGYGASHRGYVGLSSYWASQGYVVIRLSHADAGKLRAGANAEEAWAEERPPQWRERAGDVTFVLDSLDALERQYPELQGKIDRNRIGVGGHSYGAFTAMLVGGARTFPGAVTYADRRVKAVVAMSPQGTSEIRGLTQESWRELTIPTLFMVGSLDRGFVSETETPEWRREAFTYSPAGDKWLAVIENAGHFAFAGRMDAQPDARVDTPARVTDPRDPRDPRPSIPEQQDPRRPGREGVAGLRQRGVQNTIKAISLAFWDAYLKGEEAGRKALEDSSNRGGVELLTK